MTPSFVEQRRARVVVGSYSPGIAREFCQIMNDVDKHDKSFADRDPALYLATYSLRNHLARVSLASKSVAREMSWPQEDVDRAEASGLAHDLGKVEAVCELYRQNRPLTRDECRIVSMHPGLSAERLEAIKPRVRKEDHPFLDDVMHIARCHHKPYYLLDERLRRIAYCIKVADAWITMQEDRGYNVVRGEIEAYNELRETDFVLRERDSGHRPYLGLMGELTKAVGRAFLLPGLAT